MNSPKPVYCVIFSQPRKGKRYSRRYKVIAKTEAEAITNATKLHLQLFGQLPTYDKVQVLKVKECSVCGKISATYHVIDIDVCTECSIWESRQFLKKEKETAKYYHIQ